MQIRFKLIILLLLLFSTSLFSQEININNIIDQATKESKQIFIYLHKTDCSYCDSMIEFTLNEKKVKNQIAKNFLLVQINITKHDHVVYNDFEGSAKAFAETVGYNIYPTCIFINSNYEIIYAVPGYQKADIFLHMLKFVASNAYEKMDFTKYKKKSHYRKSRCK